MWNFVLQLSVCQMCWWPWVFAGVKILRARQNLRGWRERLERWNRDREYLALWRWLTGAERGKANPSPSSCEQWDQLRSLSGGSTPLWSWWRLLETISSWLPWAWLMGVISLVAFSSLFNFDELDFPRDSVGATIYVITERKALRCWVRTLCNCAVAWAYGC